MVSGLVTSPDDHPLMTSGEASWILMAVKFVLRRTSLPSLLVIMSFPVERPGKSGDWSPGLSCMFSALLEADVQTETLEFLDQHVERLRHAGIRRVLTLDDRLVDARPPAD